jgi:hypothetical protein
LEPIVDAFLLLVSKILLSIAVSLSVLYMLSRPLVNVLVRICPDEQAAVFWQSYTKVMLLIAPLLLVLTLDLFAHFIDPLDSVRFAIVSALGGTLFALHSVGRRLGRFVVVPKASGDAP